MTEPQSRSALVVDDADEYRPEPPAPPEIPAWKDGSIRIGIHTSIAGDITESLEIAKRLGANALQIFSSSPRMWDRGSSRISDADATRFRARRKELALGPLVIHCNYLINLASPDRVLRARSIQAFHQEIVRAVTLEADYLVLHPGSAPRKQNAAPGADPCSEAIADISQGLKQAARGVKLGSLQILLENTAGQGNCVGARFEELKRILDSCPELPLGVCVDTAHLFAAGWDIRTSAGLDEALAHIEVAVGLHRVRVLHVNDSKAPHGSRVDRHEHIGKGHIGRDAFRLILNHELLAGRAFILETPVDKPGDDIRNVATLWKLVGRSVRATGDGMQPRRKRPLPKKKLFSAKRTRRRN
jgi:deoxyribonuclease IV